MTITRNAGAGALCVTLLAAAPQLMAQQEQQQQRTPQQQQAQQEGYLEPDPSNMYVGAGISWNSLSRFDDSVGWQVFAGIDLWRQDLFTLGAEVGFMDTRDFDRTTPIGRESVKFSGLWATGVATYNLRDFIENSYALARAGLDFGDDDGFLFGIGAGYAFGPQLDARVEYVFRDNVDSLQINGLFRF